MLSGDAGVGKMRLAAEALERAAGRRLVLAVDDAHLLDDVSATLVSQLVRRRACFVVATLRVGEPGPDAVSGMWKDVWSNRIVLRPLSPEDVAALVSAARVVTGSVLAQAHS